MFSSKRIKYDIRRRRYVSELQEWVMDKARDSQHDIIVSIMNAPDGNGGIDPNKLTITMGPTEEDEEYKKAADFTGKL